MLRILSCIVLYHFICISLELLVLCVFGAFRSLISLFSQILIDTVASYLSHLSHFMCGIISIRVCASFGYLFVYSLLFDCILCRLGFSCCPIICDRVRWGFRDVVSIILLPMFFYLITCRVVLFNRVRLGRVVDFTGLPVYWFYQFVCLVVLELSLFLACSCRPILLL